MTWRLHVTFGPPVIYSLVRHDSTAQTVATPLSETKNENIVWTRSSLFVLGPRNRSRERFELCDPDAGRMRLS